MSAYEDYTAVSADYDRTRVPIGVEIILGCLAAASGGPLASLRVLDAGCGTGSYAAALRPHVGAIDGVDLNPSMLEVARGKLERGPGCPVALHEAGIEALPFEDARFDAVMVNQVLHHLPDSPATAGRSSAGCSPSFARVLRPGGAVIVNTCSHEQIRHGWWYAALVPDAVEAMCGRHADTGVLTRLLAEAGGSKPRGRFVPSDALMRGDAYFDGRGSPRPRLAPRRLAVVGRCRRRSSRGPSRRSARSTRRGPSTPSSPSTTAGGPSIGQTGFHYAVRAARSGCGPAPTDQGRSIERDQCSRTGFE